MMAIPIVNPSITSTLTNRAQSHSRKTLYAHKAASNISKHNIAKKSRNGLKKRLSFHPKLEDIKYIEQATEMTKQAKKEIWYSAEDCQAMRNSTFSKLREELSSYHNKSPNFKPLNYCQPNNDEVLCIRGIENQQSLELYKQSRIRRKTATSSVLNVQSWQKFRGVKIRGLSDQETIAMASIIQSKSACKEALMKGLQDARDAIHIYLESDSLVSKGNKII